MPRSRSALRTTACLIFGVGACLLAAVHFTRGDATPDERRSAPGPVTINWAGDFTPGSQYGLPPSNGRRMLHAVRGRLRRATLTFLNFEGTLGVGGTTKCGAAPSPDCFAFQAPPQNAASLRGSGVDVVNIANNHAFDAGPTGMGQTVRALSAVGVGVTGRPFEVRRIRAGSTRIALLGFAAYPWATPINDLVATHRAIAAIGRTADIVVVFIHGGAEGRDAAHVPPSQEEFHGEVRGALRIFAQVAIDAGADVVLGSGPHVLRGMELYRHRLIAYSLGNLAGFKNFSTAGALSVSAILHVRLAGDGRFRGGRLWPLVLDRDGSPRPDPRRRAVQLVAALSRSDFGASAVRFTPTGGLRGR